jgi:aspartate/methionine/tyrosine aminotransferase
MNQLHEAYRNECPTTNCIKEKPLSPLARFPLVDWFAAAEGRFDFSLSHSDCEPLNCSDLLNDQELKDFGHFRLGYGPFAGLEDLRNLVAHQYQTIKPEDVLIFSGASEAIYTFMRTMLKPGDEVVVQSPMFQSLHAIAKAIGCRLVEWQPAHELTCSFDVSALSHLCNERTKLLVFNFPHNPSGQMISESDLRWIVEIARKSKAYIFSDEQFRLLELPPTSPIPAACDLYEKAISISSVSKTYGLGGLRIGWMATRSPEVILAAKEYRFYTTEMTNTPCQILAARALERGTEILDRNRSRIQANLERLSSFVDRHKGLLVLHPPKAGTMALVEQLTPLSGREFCTRLLEEERVFLVPGGVMGMSDRLLRFGIGRNDFSEGLERVGNVVSRLASSTS